MRVDTCESWAKRRAAWGVAWGVALGLLWAGPAAVVWAHTPLVSVAPAPGATVAVSPTTVELVFKQPAKLIKLGVSGVQGAPVALRGGSLMLQGAHHRVPLPALASGRHTVRWRAISADGHVIKGQWSFTVGAP